MRKEWDFGDTKPQYSRTASSIKMLSMLSSGNIMKVSELAEMLGTNPRNIIEYKMELKEAGYNIESVAGKNGGYRLIKSKLFPVLNLTLDESKAVLESLQYIKNKSDFLHKQEYENAVNKICASVKYFEPIDETFSIDGTSLAMSSEEIKKRYNIINECIVKTFAVSIDFLSNDNVVRTRIVHPYRLFKYHDAWFFIGFDESVEDFRYFKLNRIEKIVATNAKFRKKLYYDENKYFDKNGFKSGQDWDGHGNNKQAEFYRIKLQLSGRPAMYVKEYIYGKNQIVTPIDKDTTILECDMQYRYNVIKFVLGFGVDCKVLGPKWLKEEIKKIAKEMSKEDNKI